MSTGADNKTMPVTPEYAENHERIFGDRKQHEPVERRVYVMRCEMCDGFTHPEDAKLYMCPRCRGWLYASVDASIAPPLQEVAEAKNAPIMAGRFYENTTATDGTDIGSRTRHREYMRRHGLTTADDYKGQWKQQAEQREAARNGKVPSKTRREVIERKMYQIDKP